MLDASGRPYFLRSHETCRTRCQQHVDGECIGGVRTEVVTAYASAIVYVSVDMISPVLHLHRTCFVDLYCILELSR